MADQKATITKWKDRMSIAKKNQEDSFKKFAGWFDDMYGILQKKDQIAKWRSKVYFPKLTAKFWQIAAKLVLDKPGFHVSGKGEEPNIDGAKLFENLLDYQYENPEFDEPMFKKLFDCLADAMVTGKGIALVPWTAKEKIVKEQLTEPVIDPETGEEVDRVLTLEGYEKVKKFVNAFPDFQPINIFNFFFSPSGKSLQSKHWVIIKDYKTIAELKELNDKSGIERYKNLDSLAKHTAESDEYAQYNASRNRLVSEQDPISADSTIAQIEVWHCFEKDTNTITTIAPKANLVLREIHNPYWHGKYPIVDFEIKPRPHDFWGEGIFEVGRQLQAATNSVINHYMDNMNLSMDGMIMHDELTTIYNYTIQPGGELIYAGPKPEQFKFPAPDPTQLRVIDEYLSRALDEITITPYAAGTPNAASDKTQGTKGGIMALQAAADDLLALMKNCFKTSLRQVGLLWLQMDQQFIDRTLYIDMVEDGKRIPKEINPAKIQGQFDLRLDDELDKPADPEMEMQKFDQTIQKVLALKNEADKQAMMRAQGAPIGMAINFETLVKRTLEHGGLDENDEILEEIPQQGMPMQDPNMMMGGENLPPQMPPMPQLPPQMMNMPPQEEMPVESPEMPVEENMGFMDRLRGIFRR